MSPDRLLSGAVILFGALVLVGAIANEWRRHNRLKAERAELLARVLWKPDARR